MNEIKLLKNNDKRDDSDFAWIREFYRFLQGDIPERMSFRRGHAPKMSAKKAFAIIYYLQEHFSVFPDTIEQCWNCNELFHTSYGGLYWESKGRHYCGGCSDMVPDNYDNNQWG